MEFCSSLLFRRERKRNDGQTVSEEFRYVIDVIVWQQSNELAAARKCDCAQVPLNIHEQARTHWRRQTKIGWNRWRRARRTQYTKQATKRKRLSLSAIFLLFSHLWMPNTSTKFGRTHITRARALNKHDSLHAKIKRSDYELFLFILADRPIHIRMMHDVISLTTTTTDDDDDNDRPTRCLCAHN